jgi:hypothetical protein
MNKTMHNTHRLLVAAAACLPILVQAQQASLWVEVGGARPAPTKVLSEIVERRFDSLKPGLFSSVSAKAEGARIAVRFSGWTPSSDQIDYLLRTSGRMKVSFHGERDSPLFVETDVADSRPITTRERPELAVRLTESAAKRVESKTRSANSRELIVEWEGRVAVRLRVSGPLSRDIALTLPPEYDTLLVSAALRGGRIPDGTLLTVSKQP